jgi:hypothetical protein
MNTANSIYSHTEFNELLKDVNNQSCFDCGIIKMLNIDSVPVAWASVNNAIYLCLSCAGVHRGFGVSTSYVRSITIDSWNENQMSIIRTGGNKRLKDLLNVYEIDHKQIQPETLYKSKLLDYHRSSVNFKFKIRLKVMCLKQSNLLLLLLKMLLIQ